MSEKSRWIWNQTQLHTENWVHSFCQCNQDGAISPASLTSYNQIFQSPARSSHELATRLTDEIGSATAYHRRASDKWPPKSSITCKPDWLNVPKSSSQLMKDANSHYNYYELRPTEALWRSPKTDQSLHLCSIKKLSAPSGPDLARSQLMLLKSPCPTPTSSDTTSDSSILFEDLAKMKIQAQSHPPEEGIYSDISMRTSSGQVSGCIGERTDQSVLTELSPETFSSIIWNQAECRALQEKVTRQPEIYLDHVLTMTLPILHQVIEGRFGNYLVQKIAQVCSEQQLYQMLYSIQDSLFLIASNIYGTRALQGILKAITSPRQMSLFENALKNHITFLALDKVGNHILHTYLDHCDRSRQNVVTEAIRGNIIKISTNRYGCCVLQHTLKIASPSDRCLLVEACLAKLSQLQDDPFGNYVCQSVLDLKIHEYTRRVYFCMKGSFAKLSTRKFSSNVVEKLLKASDPECFMLILSELESPSILFHLLQDQYGNYVVQTALSIAVKNKLANWFADRVRSIVKENDSQFSLKIQSNISLM